MSVKEIDTVCMKCDERCMALDMLEGNGEYC